LSALEILVLRNIVKFTVPAPDLSFSLNGALKQNIGCRKTCDNSKEKAKQERSNMKMHKVSNRLQSKTGQIHQLGI
jgi:hypothetical protein